MRRILEVFERQQNSLHVFFLDWSTAFDSVTFPAIESALHHMGVPVLFVKSIMSLYSALKFSVRDAGNTSDISRQTRAFVKVVHSPLTYLASFSVIYSMTLNTPTFPNLVSPVSLTPRSTLSTLTTQPYSPIQLNNFPVSHLLQNEASIRGLHLNFW